MMSGRLIHRGLAHRLDLLFQDMEGFLEEGSSLEQGMDSEVHCRENEEIKEDRMK